jgi:hypothetical protein
VQRYLFYFKPQNFSMFFFKKNNFNAFFTKNKKTSNIVSLLLLWNFLEAGMIYSG